MFELDEVQQKLKKVEEKWFKDEINKDTYDRWYTVYSSQILNLQTAIERLSTDQGKVFEILDSNLDILSDIRYVFTKSDTSQKREFINMVFNKNLYYQNGDRKSVV